MWRQDVRKNTKIQRCKDVFSLINMKVVYTGEIRSDIFWEKNQKNLEKKIAVRNTKKYGEENFCEKCQEICRRKFLCEKYRKIWTRSVRRQNSMSGTNQSLGWQKKYLSIKNFTFSCEIFSSRHSQLNFSTNFRSSFDNL